MIRFSGMVVRERHDNTGTRCCNDGIAMACYGVAVAE